MGIYDWVTSLTGSWGPALLSAYEANSLWINGAVILYGLVLLLTWQNTDRIADALVRQIVAQAHRAQGSRHGAKRKVRLSALHLSWDEALSEGRFPLIARQMDLVPRRLNMENLRRTISDDYLIKRSAPRLKRLDVEVER